MISDFHQLIEKYRFFINFFMVSRKEWSKPKKTDFLIFDECGANFITPYMVAYSVSILATRGELVNIPCLVLSIFERSFWSGRIINAYIERYIRVVSPKYIITFIDNNKIYYKLFLRFPDIKTIFIQNGLRGKIFVNESQTEKFGKVDYMCVFGEGIGKYYSSYLNGKITEIGSFKNNSITRQKGGGVDGILFISQWHHCGFNSNTFYYSNNGSAVSWDNFFYSDMNAVTILDKWCFLNKKTLKICGRDKINSDSEKKFYEKLIKHSNWEFIKNIDEYSSYHLVDSSEIIVTVDSTLGYESLARNKKTAFFSCRGHSIGDDDRVFGWPLPLPSEGPYWTNELSPMKLERILDFLYRIDDESWVELVQQSSKGLINLDAGNSIFMDLLQDIA